MDGVTFNYHPEFAVCCVEQLSEQLKKSIRRNLSRICHGADQADSGRAMHRYEQTIVTFWNRYSSKTTTTQIGMLGELLSHVVLLDHFPKLEVVSPYFNLEEKSIRKGFDILLYEQESNAVWITEVKSGEIGKGKSACASTTALLSKARDDLKSRLAENELNHWQNAIHAAKIAIHSTSTYKQVVIDLLQDEGDIVSAGDASAEDNNVFLISALFTSIATRVQCASVKQFADTLNSSKTFKSAFVLSLQKGTLLKLHEFLKSEAGC